MGLIVASCHNPNTSLLNDLPELPANAAEFPRDAAVVLFGQDIVDEAVKQIPVISNIASFLVALHAKYQARKDVLQELEHLGKVVAFLAHSLRHLPRREHQAFVEEALTELHDAMDPTLSNNMSCNLSAEDFLEKLMRLEDQLKTRLAAVNFMVSCCDTAQPSKHDVPWIPQQEVDLPEVGRSSRSLGKGSFSVYRARWVPSSGRLTRNVAVKVYDIVPPKQNAVLKNAVLQMSSCHPNVLRILGMVQGPEGEMWCLSPLEPLGSLYDVLFSAATSDAAANAQLLLAEEQCTCSVLFGIASALQHMHNRQPPVVHLDLKTKNVLLREEAPGIFKPLVNDFDCAIKFQQVVTPSVGVLPLGTYSHMAPEIINAPMDMRLKTPAADIYSFGILVFEVVCRQPPFSDISHTLDLIRGILEQGKRPRFQDPSPAGRFPTDFYKQLASCCWHADPQQRPHAKGVAAHLRKHLLSLDPELASNALLQDPEAWCSVVAAGGIGEESCAVESLTTSIVKEDSEVEVIPTASLQSMDSGRGLSQDPPEAARGRVCTGVTGTSSLQTVSWKLAGGLVITTLVLSTFIAIMNIFPTECPGNLEQQHLLWRNGLIVIFCGLPCAATSLWFARFTLRQTYPELAERGLILPLFVFMMLEAVLACSAVWLVHIWYGYQRSLQAQVLDKVCHFSVWGFLLVMSEMMWLTPSNKSRLTFLCQVHSRNLASDLGCSMGVLISLNYIDIADRLITNMAANSTSTFTLLLVETLIVGFFFSVLLPTIRLAMGVLHRALILRHLPQVVQQNEYVMESFTVVIDILLDEIRLLFGRLLFFKLEWSLFALVLFKDMVYNIFQFVVRFSASYHVFVVALMLPEDQRWLVLPNAFYVRVVSRLALLQSSCYVRLLYLWDFFTSTWRYYDTVTEEYRFGPPLPHSELLERPDILQSHALQAPSPDRSRLVMRFVNAKVVVEKAQHLVHSQCQKSAGGGTPNKWYGGPGLPDLIEVGQVLAEHRKEFFTRVQPLSLQLQAWIAARYLIRGFAKILSSTLLLVGTTLVHCTPTRHILFGAHREGLAAVPGSFWLMALLIFLFDVIEVTMVSVVQLKSAVNRSHLSRHLELLLADREVLKSVLFGTITFCVFPYFQMQIVSYCQASALDR